MTLGRSLFILAALAGSAAAAPTRDVFAIVVTNNHASELGRPDLRYADDDGAKYYEVFTTLAPSDHVFLLTELDRDTRGLFPQLVDVAKPPTRANVEATAALVAGKTRAALDAGHEVELYFVFAGHGDVDNGAGFLELADGRLTNEDLDKEVLSGIRTTHTHVILDSCNSFFVVNARKPGGHRFATPTDLADNFAKKLPNVGVFLSTSAEQEVFEWSELQSGIFSHAVRSGLAGAADADGDGVVSYAELRAFVTVASEKVKNPLFRPNVFARGPGGKNDSALVDLKNADAVTVTVGPDETRLTVRDKDELPWIDAHTERGATVALRIPRRIAEGGAIEAAGHSQMLGNADVAMADLPVDPRPSDSRGPDDMLRMLFAEPFGPGAMAQVRPDLDAPQVFGVTQEDGERMDLLLGTLADQQRSERHNIAGLAFGAGAVFGALSVAGLTDGSDPRFRDFAYVGLASSAALVATGAIELFIYRTPGEKIYTDYRRAISLHLGDDAQIVANMDARLRELANRQASARRLIRNLGLGVIGFSIAGWAGYKLSGSHGARADAAVDGITLSNLFLGGAYALLGATMGKTTEERIYDIWQGDPGMKRLPRVGIAPAPGGAYVSIGASF